MEMAQYDLALSPRWEPSIGRFPPVEVVEQPTGGVVKNRSRKARRVAGTCSSRGVVRSVVVGEDAAPPLLRGGDAPYAEGDGEGRAHRAYHGDEQGIHDLFGDVQRVQGG